MKQLYEVLNKKYGFCFFSNKSIRWDFFFENVKNFDIKIAKEYRKDFNFDLLFYTYELSEDEIEELIDYVDWDIISEHQKLSENFIEKYQDKLNWDDISMYQKLSENFIEKHADKINWIYISDSQILSEKFIEKHIDKLDLDKISFSQNLSLLFMEKFLQCTNLELIVGSQTVSEEYIEKNIEYFTDSMFQKISHEQHLSEKFMDKYANKLNWTALCVRQKLSENFIEKHADKVDWGMVSVYQKLSEDFIRRHQEEVTWSSISYFQKLSEKFIDEFKHKVDWMEICKTQKLSKQFIQSHENVIYKLFIEDNWIYKTTEEKKQAVINTGLYECHDDYFIAYKAIRKDRYSLFNFQYKYESGCIYESWCDCSNNEDSFGLNVGTKLFAFYYGGTNSLIVKCKIKYKDIGNIVHDGDKIRCFKIEVLD